MIVSKPRQIRIDLDPDKGFPVSLSVESTRYVEEGGVKVADLPAHVESFDPASKQAKDVLGAATAKAIENLALYQGETQRLGKRVKELEDEKAAKQPKPK